MKAADSNLLDGKKETDRIAAVCGERQVEKGHFLGTSENFCGIFAELKKVLAFDCCFCYYI